MVLSLGISMRAARAGTHTLALASGRYTFLKMEMVEVAPGQIGAQLSSSRLIIES